MENLRIILIKTHKIVQIGLCVTFPEMANQTILLNETGELNTISADDLILRLTAEELLSRKYNTVERYRKNERLSQPTAELYDIEYKPEK